MSFCRPGTNVCLNSNRKESNRRSASTDIPKLIHEMNIFTMKVPDRRDCRIAKGMFKGRDRSATTKTSASTMETKIITDNSFSFSSTLEIFIKA
ncbi:MULTISPECIES: hypothetical protein [Thermofilum]|uniref:Uncharacterized protein n=1 Tax=Thermofilum adornatum TaxID=1365176 RepID=S5ZWV6_9CREN|nr:hypothetical protein [Thermofilum adornatum]AGT35699.1 hypothetical protein N186_06805 [Thermofilum adornatum]